MPSPDIIFKKFKILPDGDLIVGGWVSYTLDPVTGHVRYDGQVVAHYLFADHVKPFSGVYGISPSLLKSSTMKVKELFDVGPVHLFVNNLIPGKTMVANVGIAGTDITAIVHVSLAGETMEVLDVSGSGSIYGFKFKLLAEPY